MARSVKSQSVPRFGPGRIASPHRSKKLCRKGLAVALAAAATGFSGRALAHDALPTAAQPEGWTYPYSCCSGIDCRAVPGRMISERPEGYVISTTGEVVAYTDSRVKNSPDGVYHWCSIAGADNTRTICLFVPPRMF